MEEDAERAQRGAATRRAEDEFRTKGGYAAESEARSHRRRSRPRRRPDGPADRRALRWRAAPRRAVPHPVRRRDVLLLDEPTNHLDVDAKDVAAELPAHVPRRAARHQPRPRPARRGDHPRAPPRPPGRGRPRPPRRVQGHLQPVPRRRGPPTRSAWPRRPRRAGQGDRPAADRRRPLRRQGHEGGDGAQHGEADRRLEANGVDGDPKRTARCACASPIRPRRAAPS